MIKSWIEAMRLRTLPVSVAGVLAADAIALANGCYRPWPATFCLLFALLAQIASNFANEYYDYKKGLDKPGREGPRRGVTEGDIAPGAMKRAAIITLGIGCCFGLCLVPYGGWWLVPTGIAIALGAFSYSAGPYPLSHHGLGEAAVFVFFGLVPVNLTYYVQALDFSMQALLMSCAIGWMGSNVLIVNNYRDVYDDASVGKRTLAVRLGREAMPWLYLAFGIAAWAAALPVSAEMSPAAVVADCLYLSVHVAVWSKLQRLSGARLNPFLGITSMLMFAFSAALLLIAARIWQMNL